MHALAPPSAQKEPEPPPPPELPPPENPPPPELDDEVEGGVEPTLPSASNMPPMSGMADPENTLPEP